MNENENNKYDNNEYKAGGNNMNEINNNSNNNEYNEYNNTNDLNHSTFNNMNNIGNSFNNSAPINNNMNNNMNSNYIPNFIMGEQIKTEHIREQQINEEKKRRLEEKRAKRKKFAVSFAASMAAIAVCGAGIGMGVSLGNGMMNKAGIGNNSVKDFSFNEDTIIVPNTAENTELMSTNTIAPIIKNVKDAVVNINIIVERRDFFNQAYQNTGSGSGIIYKEDAEKVYIITNNHVVDGANKVTISITGDEQISASLVGKDAQSDLAVIYVLKSDLEKAGIHEVSVAKFADSSYIEVGEYVIAIGNALGAGKTVTQGIISAQNKNITIDGKKLTVLQTDAAINPGNSGGALVNTDGEVIGINTAKISSTTIEGMGYAIPSSIAVSIANELITNGSIERPYLGVEVFTITDAFKSMYNIDINGVFIRAVTSGSTAEEAGLRSTDIITGFNGQEITTVDDLSEAINNCQANQEVTLSIIRNGVEPMNIVVRLAAAEKNF